VDGTSRRQEIKDLVKALAAGYPDLKSKVFGAMQRLPLKDNPPAAVNAAGGFVLWEVFPRTHLQSQVHIIS